MTKPHRERAANLLSRMTLNEKVAQLFSIWLKMEPNGDFALRDLRGFVVRENPQEARDLLRDGVGGITRPLGTHPIRVREGIRALNGVQKILVEKTRLGIPALPHEECLAGVMADGATLFPAGINYGSTWDPDLMEKIARAIGDELVSAGSRQGLAPVLDVSRDVRWGRTEETFGEDPYLCGSLAVAYVRGLQGNGRRVLATLKHFAGHSFGEGGRNHAPVRVGERELNDVFLLPFEMAVKLGGAGSVMPAYHDIDGVPTTASNELIAGMLRKRWGFDGIVVSDYEAISLLREHHRVARDEAEAAALAIKAGIDMELPGFTCFRTGVEQALERDLLSIDVVNAAVTRVLVEKSRLGLFEHPYTSEEAVCFNTAQHRRVAAEAASKSIVLLKNDGILPLSDRLRKEGTIAVIGPLADDRLAMYCGYSFPVHVANGVRAATSETCYGRTIREALARRLPPDRLVYSRGCDILAGPQQTAPVFPGDAGVGRVGQLDNVSRDEDGIPEAVEAASHSDLVLLILGDLAGLFLTGTVGEGSDASSLLLPGVQQKLLDAILATAKPTVIVLVNGRPYNLGAGYDKANGVLEAWLPGEEGGEAIADILLGDRAPAGRLPISIPKSAGSMPYFYNHKLKSAGTPVQRDFGARFPFGHGLTYTEFEYSDFSIETPEVAVDGEIVVSVRIRNIGGRDGEEVVQLYVSDPCASLVRPVVELKGFARVAVGVGESRVVRFEVPTDMLSFSVDATTRIVEPGDIEIMIGSSATDIACRGTVRVTGEVRRLPKSWRMTSRTVLVAALPDIR